MITALTRPRSAAPRSDEPATTAQRGAAAPPRRWHYLTMIVLFVGVNFVVSTITPWHLANHAYVTDHTPRAVSVADRQAVMDGQLADAMTRLRCSPPTMWPLTHPGVLPATMILKRDHSFTLDVRAWTYPAPAGYWTMALCAEGRTTP